jgi:hypothetical protein
MVAIGWRAHSHLAGLEPPDFLCAKNEPGDHIGGGLFHRRQCARVGVEGEGSSEDQQRCVVRQGRSAPEGRAGAATQRNLGTAEDSRGQ